MSGSLLNRARRDSKKYVTRSGWEENITLSTTDVTTQIAITGWVSKHWINYDSDGAPINTKNAHICIDEDVLEANGYPYRNSNSEVHLKNHRVTTKDSTGVEKHYVIKEWFPDETLGLIVCILVDYAG